MSATPWDDMTRGWTEMYNRQTELAKEWFDGHTQLTNTLSELAEKTNPFTGLTEGLDGVNPLADAERCPNCGGPGPSSAGRWAAACPVSAPTAGSPRRPSAGSPTRWPCRWPAAARSGTPSGRMTEGPRFADIGAAEHRMAKLFGLWMAVQTAARELRTHRRRCMDESQPAVRP